MIRAQSPAVELGVRAASPLAVLVGVYLLFAGHNNPGGGFAAGLVFGAVVVLRSAAGMRRVADSITLIAVGTIVVCAVAAAPLLLGEPLLDQGILEVEVPVLGTVKTGGALPFDIGVTLVVVGVVMGFVDCLSPLDLNPNRSGADSGPGSASEAGGR